MNRRDLLVLLPASLVVGALPSSLMSLLEKTPCVVEVELRFPHQMSPAEVDEHLLQMQDSEKLYALFTEFIEAGRMKYLGMLQTEGQARWTYHFNSMKDVRQWANAIREKKMVNKDYLGGVFVWTTRLNGEVVA